MQKGLPNRFYTTREDFLLEREMIFSSMWTCIGFASDTAESGDAFPLEFMELPTDSARRGSSTACFS